MASGKAGLPVGPTLQVYDGFGKTRLMTFEPFRSKLNERLGSRLIRCKMDATHMDWKPMHTVGQGVKEIRIRDCVFH